MANRKYLVTIDREEWKRPRRWEFWKPEWHTVRGRRYDRIEGIGRTVFEVDRAAGTCRPLFQLPQKLDSKVMTEAWTEQDAWTKSITRGLRAISVVSDGTLVINDIFGAYHVTREGEVLKYVTSDRWSDVHCAVPNADNTCLLITSTGTEEVFEVDWEGEVHRRLHVPDLFGLPQGPRVAAELEKHGDRRTMRLDHNRELFHVNWAEWVREGETMMISCHAPGTVAMVQFGTDGAAPVLGERWSYYPHCHGPSIDGDSILVAVSKTDEVVEIDMRTGKAKWVAGNLGYSKRVVPLDADTALACDCNGKRLVELDRSSGRHVWSCELPGLPFAVAVDE